MSIDLKFLELKQKPLRHIYQGNYFSTTDEDISDKFGQINSDKNPFHNKGPNITSPPKKCTH